MGRNHQLKNTKTGSAITAILDRVEQVQFKTNKKNPLPQMIFPESQFRSENVTPVHVFISQAYND